MIKKMIFFIFLVLLLGIIIIAFLQINNVKNKMVNLNIKSEVNSTEKVLISKNLPADLVANSVVSELFANVEGYVSEKYDDYFVLKNGENTLKLYVEEAVNLTHFYKDNVTPGNDLLYKDIKIGDHLFGGVSTITKISSSEFFFNRPPGDFFAHSMRVLP